MTSDDRIFKAFSSFGLDGTPAEAVVSRRMLRRLENIDDAKIYGPTTPAARPAQTSRVVAHAVVEFELRLIELQRQLALKLMMKPPLIDNDCPALAQQVSGVAR